jgi:hypothetical protein
MSSVIDSKQCRNPTLRELWGHHSHSLKWDLGVLRDSQKLRVQLQGSKHLALKHSLYHWKGLEVQMSKMASHEPFRHMQHKLWSKEGSGVILAIWLSTTKSQESTRFWCVQVKWNTPLESSWGELQLWFRPHLNPSWGRGVMSVQSPKSPNRDNFETPLWESWEKEPFGCRCGGELQRILYGGRWWLPPSPGRGESSESKLDRGLSQHQKGVEWIPTNLLVGFGCRTV